MSTTKIPVETDSLTLDLNVIRNPNKTRQLLTTDNVGITQDQNLRYNIQYITNSPIQSVQALDVDITCNVTTHNNIE